MTMINRVVTVVLMVVGIAMYGCGGERSGDGSSASPDAVTDPSAPLWSYDYDTTIQDFRLTRLRTVDSDTLNVATVFSILNNTWPNINLVHQKTSNDTIFIYIPSSEYLTQQMGSTGPVQFFVAATYSLTELEGIRYVYYQFQPGDHAEPGVYSRESF